MIHILPASITALILCSVLIQPVKAADTQAPTTPPNLAATTIAATQVNLSWTPSTDNVAVTQYSIYRNNVWYGYTYTASYTDSGVSPQTTYSYRILAMDAASNYSELSSILNVTTPVVSSGCPIDSSYKLVFDDEFNGTGLNTSNWSTGWFGSGVTPPLHSYETACYDPARVTVSGGLLNLNAIRKNQTCGGQTRRYSSGLISSNGKKQFTYGYFEARMFLPPSGTKIANWPAWWLDGQNWPADGEIDIMEGLGGSASGTFHSSAGAQSISAVGNFSGWHVFAVKWSPNNISYYYDNNLIGTFTQNVTSSPMYLILNNAMSPLNYYGGPIVAPATMKVDWVHVYSNDPAAVAITPQVGYVVPGGCTQ